MNRLPEQIERFLKSTGRLGAKKLSFLGEHVALVEAMETEIGKTILDEAVTRHEQLAVKVLHGIASEDEKFERKALFGILERWATKINDYHKVLSEINKY